MTTHLNIRRIALLKSFSRAASASVVFIGCLALVGWALNITVLKSVLPGLVTMKANTALTFVLAGVSLWILCAEQTGHRVRRVARACAVIVALIGFFTLGEYLFGWNLSMDQLLFKEPLGAVGTFAPGRMAPTTALNFLVIGLALVAFDAPRGFRAVQVFTLAAGAIGLLNLVGYAYGVKALYGLASYTQMAVHTAAAFIVLSVGLLFARPDRGLMAIVSSDGAGGVVARRLLPAAFGVPFLLGWLRLIGQRAGFYGTEFGVAIFALSTVIVLAVVTWANAGLLYRTDAERKRAEEAARQAKEAAEEASRAKSDFLSRMSHELRTPLNAVLGFAQLLEMGSLDREDQESVEQILKAGRHLLELINEVLDISRIEAGRLAISPEPVSVKEVVQESLDLIAPLAAAGNIQLTDDLLGTRNWYVQADRQRLKQVLLNLLSNAIKFNRNGGMVAFSYEQTPEGRLRIKVNDTGPGISATRMAQLFTPFERLGAEQVGIEGTGLGLALSKGLVEAMGGTLSAESIFGQGSTFWLELPLVDRPAEPRCMGVPAPAELKPSSTAAIVLYVEDNLSNVKLIQRLLAHRPEVRLVPAMQGRLGLDLALEHRPHLILLDLHLPDMPGEEVLLRLRAAPETRDIPVAVISADATPGQIRRLLANGARAYLTKPLDVKKLLEVLDETLKEREPSQILEPALRLPGS